MKQAALIIGLIGGILGLMFAFLAVFAGVMNESTNTSGITVGEAYIGCLIALVAITGGALARALPKIAIALLLIACIGGFLRLGLFWFLPGPLLFVSALLLIISLVRKQKPSLSPPPQL